MLKKAHSTFGKDINRALKQYFNDLEGTDPISLHQQMVQELERYLFAYVMSYTGGNVSRAAKILGISRPTLRKKLIQYKIL